jgi:A/G-specific adenine glycosylase
MLLAWYATCRRDLPWRQTSDPYQIWLSEVILQQTRVDQGMAYWHRFVERFPSVQQLAEAPEDAVLKLWQGLGYYSRARNLHTAARQVMEQHDGAFPAEYQALLALKGVGEYTAAAIGSICFGLPEPVVDGNVYRVLGRFTGLATPIDSTAGRREFRELASRLLDPEKPGDHNQAMMELGATICTPRSPSCGSCPLATDCVARRDGRIQELPVKAGRTKVRTRHFNYLFIECGDRFFLRKRTGKDIWQDLYELPLIETSGRAGRKQLLKGLTGLHGDALNGIKKSGEVTHLLSHQRLQAVFWQARVKEMPAVPDDWIRVTLKDLERYAVPRLIERWFQERMAPQEEPVAAGL